MDVVFVHGALVRDGEWWWRPTAELLLARSGIRSRALLLPSTGETTPAESSGGLRADAGALRRELDGREPGSTIVVGHSYGGTVIAEAGAHPAIAHLVFVSSYLPEIGQSQGAIMSGEPDRVAVGDAGEGRLALEGYDGATFGMRFLQDVARDTQRQAWERVVPQAVAAFGTPTSAAGWRGVDSTYLVCVDDRSTSVALQRSHAARATRSVDLPTGHHPFLSRPDLVANGVLTALG